MGVTRELRDGYIHARAPGGRLRGAVFEFPFVSVGAGAVVGPRTVLHAGVQLGEAVQVGADCLLYQNVVVRERCVLGDRVALQPGCVIGSDGFGYALDLAGDGSGPRHFKVPQAGNVVVEDDVEIGANTCVDRATLGTTRICRGAKIDNLVQVAHNVVVGPLSILASQVGISGSTRLGMGVVVWGQVAINGHIEIGDRANISAQSGVAHDVPAGQRGAGLPGIDEKRWARNAVAFGRVAEMRRELRELKQVVARLEGKETT